MPAFRVSTGPGDVSLEGLLKVERRVFRCVGCVWCVGCRVCWVLGSARSDARPPSLGSNCSHPPVNPFHLGGGRPHVDNRKEKKKRGSRGVFSETDLKNDIYMRIVKRNRNAIEAQQKSDFEHPTKEKYEKEQRQ